MSIKLSDSIRVGQQKPLEDKYFNELVPYTSTSQVNTLLPKAIRHIGLTVNINGEEYWYKDGIEDEDLIFKSNQKTIEVTRSELDDLISENKLEPNRLYKITGVESWCFSKHLIKAIYLKAITNNTLESEGVGEFYTPKYNTSDSNLGIWKGELLANGMISSASYNIGDKVIWGNLFWENISGNIGSNEMESMTLGTIKVDNYLSEEDWQLITPNDDVSLYNIQFNSIKYDVGNDYINYRADDLGNVYEITYNRLLTYDLSEGEDPSLIYYLNAISLFQWGRSSTYKNIIKDSLVSNCNYNTTRFYNNTVEDTRIAENNFLNVDIIRNNFKFASVDRNYLKTYGGLLYNTLESSNISSNKYYFEISYNNLKYNSIISGNNDNNIIVGSKFSIIKGNNLDNSSKIENNIFVEEGKGISGNLKGIYDNNIQNSSTISGNTIKNGSRIFGHRLEYYSTINGNTLDTDSNIYNNQLVQNGKIDNNILTGHGRIYGNQLDRLSEITLCKLRISPASSYASGIHGNRMFTGKIQNVDFGDIVNPVGTNPNDPTFGGNDLAGCIIENSSIIKDLTFPNSGGKLIQFVKMNGYSEFKNITVNDTIRNVDFINTIFNENSDYSKLIEGNGQQTNGFTKTYIDGILLQDRLDSIVDNLQIGGRNLILNSKGHFTGQTDQWGGINFPNTFIDFSKSLEVGEQYIFTYKSDISKAGLLNITLRDSNGNVLQTVFSDNSGRFIFTALEPAVKLYLYSSSVNTPFDFWEIKIEKGNKATDWIPAPEDKQDRLQDVTGNIGIGKTDASATEKLDVDGNVKSTGFKTPSGTANQSLTADGGVFDLTTKADLVDGKVPQSQLPSIGKTTFTHDILVSHWTLVSGKYEAVISNAGILSNSFVDVIPSNDHVDIVRSAQIYPSVLISEGSVKVYSKFLPSGTISLTVNII